MDPVLREGHQSFIQKGPRFTTGTRRHEALWESSPGLLGTLSGGLGVKLLCSEGPSQSTSQSIAGSKCSMAHTLGNAAWVKPGRFRCHVGFQCSGLSAGLSVADSWGCPPSLAVVLWELQDNHSFSPEI
jgi:hypothetical protein